VNLKNANKSIKSIELEIDGIQVETSDRTDCSGSCLGKLTLILQDGQEQEWKAQMEKDVVTMCFRVEKVVSVEWTSPTTTP